MVGHSQRDFQHSLPVQKRVLGRANKSDLFAVFVGYNLWQKPIRFILRQCSNKLKTKLATAINAQHLEVINESHMHSRGTESHFKVVIVSDELTVNVCYKDIAQLMKCFLMS